jgi:hypothetical protein
MSDTVRLSVSARLGGAGASGSDADWAASLARNAATDFNDIGGASTDGSLDR